MARARNEKTKNGKTSRTGQGIKSKIGCRSFSIYEWNRGATFRSYSTPNGRRDNFRRLAALIVFYLLPAVIIHRTLPGLEESSYKLHFAPEINKFHQRETLTASD